MVEETEKSKSRLERKIESIATMPYWIKASPQSTGSHENNQLSTPQIMVRHEAWVKTFLGKQDLREDYQNSLYDLMTTVTYPEKLAQGPYDVLENIHLLIAFLQPELEIFSGRFRKGSDLELEPFSKSGKNLANEYGKLVTSQLTNEDMAFTQTDILKVLAQLNISPASISPKREALLEKVVGFSKADVFSHLRKELHCVSQSDREDTIDFEQDLALVNYWCNGIDFRSKLKAESRALMLMEHPLYVKPSQGAGSYMVMSLDYNTTKNELSIKSTQSLVHQLIRVPNSNDFKSIMDSLPIPSNLDDEGEIECSLIGLHNIDSRMTVCAQLSHYEHEQDYYDVYLFEKENNISLFFGTQLLKIQNDLVLIPIELRAYSITSKSDHETIIHVSPDKLADVVYQLEGIYFCTENNSYAETKIETPLVNGKVWETRSIVQSLKAFSPKVTATYCKVGDNDVVANISVGGKGHDAFALVSKAYKLIRPKDTDVEIEKLTEQYLQKVDETVLKVSDTLSKYFIHLANSCDNFPMLAYASDISVDCMGHITKKKNEIFLTPMVVDTNITYAYTGLENSELAKEVYENKIKIAFRFADDVTHTNSVKEDLIDFLIKPSK